jgi:SseB protein C-terminal domain
LFLSPERAVKIWKLWKRGSPNARRVSEIVFLGEQDGPPERELKAALIELFSSQPKVERAYLARAQYGKHGELGLVLCIRATGRQKAITTAVSAVFERMFSKGTFLDVLFLDDKKESEVEPVCSCFFARNR